MNHPSKQTLRRFAGASLLAAMCALPMHAGAQAAYPSKVVKVIVPFPPGSPPDAVARVWAERLTQSTGQAFIIENKPGAGTFVGTQAVTSSPADGYTLLYTVATTTSINPYVFKSMPYKVEDLVPVSQILTIPFILVVAQDSPYNNAGDLVKAAESTPGKLNYASYGIGQATHVAFAKLVKMAGVSMTHIPYKDGGLSDIIGGNVQASFEPSNTAIPMIAAKKLKGIGVSTPQPLAAMPQIRPVGETVKGFAVSSWQGLFAPKGTPPDVVARLAALTQKVVESDDFRARLRDLGMVPVGSSPGEFQRFVKDDAAAWAKVVRENDIRAE